MNEAGYNVVVVGAGFAGVYLLYRLREAGHRVVVIEAAGGVGGVWYWNRYPGARCDVDSLQYSYSFSDALQREWSWSERFATQPEILSYIEHVVDRFDLARDIRLNTRVDAASFNDASSRWTLTLEGGETLDAHYVVMATGALSAARTPDIPGLPDFTGSVLQTGRWPHDGVDFAGKRVGVIGTGSSGIQAIPRIAEQAAHLHVFQRTASFSVPARNGPLDPDHVAAWKDAHAENRRRARATRSGMLYDYGTRPALSVSEEERAAEYAARWEKGGTNFLYAFADIVRDEGANHTAAEFVRGKIAETVTDPETARRLTPKGYPIGAKRICVDSDYYATFNRDNVTLVDLGETPIETITVSGVRVDGKEVPLDVLVLATGFDAMTGALLAVDIRGAGGARLREAWSAGPRTYLGLMTHGFPNLFIVTGPGSPSVLSNMVLSVEHDAEWIGDCLDHLRDASAERIEATRAAQDAWVDHVNELAAPTLYAKGNSWYLGANVPGKPRVFMPYLGGVETYQRTCAEVAADGYRGFAIDGRA